MDKQKQRYQHRLALTALFLSLVGVASAEVALNPPLSWPDVVFLPDGDIIYAFGGADMRPFDLEAQRFIMPYWQCFSSRDLVHWHFESKLDPADTYIGPTDKCFATHAAKDNNQWYWYLSNFVTDTGVAVAPTPKGPWKDALGKPLLPKSLTPTKEYDNCVFTDDDGQAYIVFGARNYYIAALNEDMISLKEEPKLIEVHGIPSNNKRLQRHDAPYLHKYKDTYYLSWRMPYATSKSVYGPYEFRGTHTAQGHGSFFTWKNQWFVSHTSIKTKEGYRLRHRWCSLAYVHYKDDGTIAPMESTIRNYGVGQYDAQWEAIEAEWHMGTTATTIKKETTAGFEMRNLCDGDFLRFPYIHNTPRDAVLELKYASAHKQGGQVAIHAYEANGPLLGRASFTPTSSVEQYRKLRVPLDHNPPGTLSLVIVFRGTPGEELMRLDSFHVTQ